MNSKLVVLMEIAIFAAIGVVLDFLANLVGFKLWANGGSISISMLPIFIIALRRGLKSGLMTGFLIGFIQLALPGAYLMHPVQVFLDYWGAYLLVGFAGTFIQLVKHAESKQSEIIWLSIAVWVGGLLRLASHVASGYVFFPDAVDPFWFSVIYNGSFMIPSIILCNLLLIPIYKRLRFASV